MALKPDWNSFSGQCGVADRICLDPLFAEHAFNGVTHFASYIRSRPQFRLPELFQCRGDRPESSLRGV